MPSLCTKEEFDKFVKSTNATMVVSNRINKEFNEVKFKLENSIQKMEGLMLEKCSYINFEELKLEVEDKASKS